MKKDQHQKEDVKKTGAGSPSTQKENTDAPERLRNPAEEDLGDLDRNLNEQFGGTGTTVRIEPNHF